MKAVIIHDSKQGNGLNVAETIGKTFTGNGIDVEIFHVSEITPLECLQNKPEILVVGAAIRVFTISPPVKRWLRKAGVILASDNDASPYTAQFLTHAMGYDKARRYRERYHKLVSGRKGFTRVHKELLSGKVDAMEGPLSEGVLDRAAEFAGNISAELKQ